MNDLLLILTLLLIAAAVYLASVTLIRALARFPAWGGPGGGAAGGREGSWLSQVGGRLVGRLGDLLEPLMKPRFAAWLKRRFLALGRADYRAQDFLARMVIYSLFFGVLGLLMLNMINRSLMLSIAFFLFGFCFPFVWLRDHIQRRHQAITRALSYHIDLLTLSVEAGLDFAQALGTVVDKGRPGPLIEELSLMLGEMKLGKTREEALRNLGERVQLGELTAFVSNLIQADRLGTSLGKVLRIQSSQLRVARAHRAEKAANEAPLRILLPLVLCFFPTVFMVLFGPLVYRFIYGG